MQNLGPNIIDYMASQIHHVSVFFNTAYNWPGVPNSDISDNSVGILSNNVYVAQVDLTPLGINLKDGLPHQSRIAYARGSLSVWLDGSMLFTNVPMPGMAQAVDAAGNAWVGFLGYCGTDFENQDILSWTFGGPTPGTAFAGGLDEFSVYQRALSPCEVNAIFNAGSRGKYGTNVLVCPVATEVTLLTTSGSQIYAFTNGLTWTNNGPHWETNTISFSTSTNPTAIVVRGLNPYNPADSNAANNLNAVVDDFVLSTLVTNTINGLLHFTEDTNLAALPIKFAPTPYIASNFPPVLIFSNGFSSALPGLYNAGSTIPGGTNSPAIGTRNWTVTQGSVTVVSNAFFDAAATNCAGDGHRRRAVPPPHHPRPPLPAQPTTSAAPAPSAGGTAASTLWASAPRTSSAGITAPSSMAPPTSRPDSSARPGLLLPRPDRAASGE